MSEYIFGTRMKTDIIDLEKTKLHLKLALNVIAHIAYRQGIILFITRYAQHIPLVENTAVESGEYSYCTNWRRGSFTDSLNIYGSVIRMPDLCIFLHTNEKLNEPHPAIIESSRMLIPTVAICDTDIDPSIITYPIPANDDSIVSQHLYCSLIKEAILRGKNQRKIDDTEN
jgi:small subunit ribosomal protein S2